MKFKPGYRIEAFVDTGRDTGKLTRTVLLRAARGRDP